MTANQATKAGPLAGVRVVEVGVWHAGPGATALLAELGAEVIKVEGLNGDPERIAGGVGPLMGASAAHGKDNWTVLFEISNRGKAGISVDLGNPASAEILRRLVDGADIFLTNLRRPAQERFGIDYPTLKAQNPRVIHVDVSGYGRLGRWPSSADSTGPGRRCRG